MSSQEDYLDKLLKNLTAQDAEENGDAGMISDGNGGTAADDKKQIFDTKESLTEDARLPEETPSEDVAEQNAEAEIWENDLSEEALAEDAAEQNAEAEIWENDLPEEASAENWPPENMTEENGQKDAIKQERSVIDLESAKEMSEEEIVRLLSAGDDFIEEPKETHRQEGEEDVSEDDLMGILDSADSADLQEIRDLLHKSDHNEAVDDDIVALLNNDSMEDPDILADIEADTKTNSETADRDRKQKAAQRKLDREAKKSEKAAKREALREKKAAQRADKKRKKGTGTEETADENQTEAVTKDENMSGYEKAESAGDMGQSFGLEQGLEDQVLSMEEVSGMESAAETEPLMAPEQDEETVPVLEPVLDTDLSDIEDLLNFADAADPLQEQAAVNQQEENSYSDISQIVNLEDAVAASENGTDQKTKKKGIFSKLLNLLTEEEEESDSDEIHLSDENKNILNELEKEKKKGKKGKKAKKADNQEALEEDGEGKPDASKGKKAKKEKGPKKEKKEKKEKAPKLAETDRAGSKLSLKRILPVALFCLSLGAVIILVSGFAGSYSAKKAGREAYHSGDYQTCYRNLYGKDLNESEKVMFGKSESILRIRLWIREYEMLAEEGAEPEALDSLIQSVNGYPTLYHFSAQWNAETEIAEEYSDILNILSEKYHLTEEQALEIAATENDADYSKKVYAIAEGQPYGAWEQPETSGENPEQTAEPSEMPEHVLPEEEELGNIPFVDNNQ